MNQTPCPRCWGTLTRDRVGEVSCFVCGWVLGPQRSAEEIDALKRTPPRRITRHAGELL